MQEVLYDRLGELNIELEEINDEVRIPNDALFSDRAWEAGIDDVLISLQGSVTREIQSIEAALERIEVGTYGACQDCDEPISVKRLNAVPHASLCAPCAIGALDE